LKFPCWIEFDFYPFFWYPYFMYGKYEEPWQAKYYGHEWFLMISIWIIEIVIFKKITGDPLTDG